MCSKVPINRVTGEVESEDGTYQALGPATVNGVFGFGQMSRFKVIAVRTSWS